MIEKYLYKLSTFNLAKKASLKLKSGFYIPQIN